MTKLHRDVRVVLTERRRRLDRRALVAEILIGELDRVAIDGELSRHVRRARLQRRARARSVASGQRLIAGERHARRASCRAPSVITARTDTGTCAGGGVGVTTSTAVVTLRGGEAAPMVQVLDRLDVGVEPCRPRTAGRRAGAAGRFEVSERHRRVARDLVGGDLELLAPRHRERDHQLAVRSPRAYAARARRGSPAPRRYSSMRLLESSSRSSSTDPSRSHRHQLGAPVRRQRVAREDDAHARTRRARSASGRRCDRRPTAGRPARSSPRSSPWLRRSSMYRSMRRVQRLALVRRARDDAEAREHLRARGGRRADDRRSVRSRSRAPGVDREHERRALGRVLEHRPRRDRRR